MLDPGVLGAGLGIRHIPTGIAHLLYYRGIQYVTETSLIPVAASSETVVATMLGVAFCGNVLGWGNIAGIATVIASIAALGLLKRKAERG